MSNSIETKALSAHECAVILADAKTSATDRKAVIARVKDMAKNSKRKRWANLLKDINAGKDAHIQARAGVISWEQAKAEAPAKPAPKAKPEALDLGELAALLAKPIPSKAERARILELASHA